MASKKDIYAFAVKWLEKYQTCQNELDVINSFDDDCFALGFKMDCGESFNEAFPDSNAFDNPENLKKIIDAISDIYLLASAIFSYWRYITHWTYDTLLSDKNREWFKIAFSRLAQLAEDGEEESTSGNIILFPDFKKIKEEVEKLKTEISMILLERDDLIYVQCKNIEMAYMLSLGSIEYKAFELHCDVLRLKRKIELIQAKKNHQEKVVLTEIEILLDEEFAEFQQQLEEQIDKINSAIERNKGRELSDAETKKMKKLYRSIVKALHPDLNPDASPAQIQLLQNAVLAYEGGDIQALEIISEMVSDSITPPDSESPMSFLVKEKERLTKNLNLLKEQISQIKSEYPYMLKQLVEDPEKIQAKRAELEQTVEDLKEVYAIYSERLKKLLE